MRSLLLLLALLGLCACPVNPLDDDDERKGGNDIDSPADLFLLNGTTTAVYDMDRIVREDGTATGSNNHPTDDQVNGAFNRDGSPMAGPLNQDTVRRLTDPATGIVLDSWLDDNGVPRGQATDHVSSGP